jgi:hypothetical protein
MPLKTHVKYYYTNVIFDLFVMLMKGNAHIAENLGMIDLILSFRNTHVFKNYTIDHQRITINFMCMGRTLFILIKNSHYISLCDENC